MKIKIVIIGLIIMCSNILIAEELITVKRFATRGKSPVFEIKIFNDSTAILNGYSNIEYIGKHKTRIINYYDTLITLLDKLDLDTLKEKYNLERIAAHVNHCLRGKEADEDEKYVEEYCKSYNIKFFSKRVDINRLAVERNLSSEWG